VLLVGELNPYGSRPELALYHLPRGASGDRLRSLAGLSDADYHKHCSRVNLCEGSWFLERARRRAASLVEMRTEEVFVLLGSRVRLAFGGPSPFCCSQVRGGRTRIVLVGLPHPSGRNRVWNDPATRDRVPRLLSRAAPWVPWGAVSGELLPAAGGAP
jgi:uracil-DNA glycosylase